MGIQELVSLMTEYGLVLAIAAVVLVTLMIALPVMLRLYRRDAEQRRVAKLIKNLNTSYLREVAFPDGMDGYLFIDYLVLTPAGILVIDLQDYSGFIFGAANIDQWTQMVRRRGFKFENPLHRNAWRVQVIQTLASDATVMGRVVFSSTSQFPKGIPEGVSHVSTLTTDIAPLFGNKSVSESLRKAWDELAKHVAVGRSAEAKKNK